MRSKTFTLWMVWLTLALAGCSRCGKAPSAKATGLTAHVPKAAQAVILIPDLGRFGDKLVQLQGMKLASFASQLQGFPSAQAYADALVAAAGVDLRSRDSLKNAGIAPERGLAVVLLDSYHSFAVLGVSDKEKLEGWLQTLARNRLGATQTTHPKPNGVEETVFASPSSGPRLAVAWVDGYALIPSLAEIERLPERARLQEGDSLAKDPAFAAATAPLPSDRDLFAYAPKGSPMLDPQLASSGAALSLDLGKDALTARIFLPRTDAKEVQAFQKVDAPDLSWMLDPESVLRMRLAVDPARFAGIWQRYLPNRINFALSAAGVDVDHQVLGNAKPGAVAELSLAQSAQLGSGMPSLDVRQTNPFRYLQLFAASGVKDPKGAEQLIDQVAQNAPRFGAQIEATQLENAKAWLTRYAQGEGADLALVGDTVVVAGPKARLDAAIPRVRLGAKASPHALREQDALMQPAVGFVLDLQQLADSVRALPSSAWGVGGFAIKATTLRWLDATNELTALTGGISGEQGGLSVDLALRFAAK